MYLPLFALAALAYFMHSSKKDQPSGPVAPGPGGTPPPKPTPDYPNIPGDFDQPQPPAIPGAPSVPGMPSFPSVPGMPSFPSVPGMPSFPSPTSPGGVTPPAPGGVPPFVPGDVSGNPNAIVAPPPPNVVLAQSVAKADYMSQGLTSQSWKVSAPALAGGYMMAELLQQYMLNNIYNPLAQSWMPKPLPAATQVLLHENGKDLVARYKPMGPTWTDLPLAGTWYLLADQSVLKG